MAQGRDTIRNPSTKKLSGVYIPVNTIAVANHGKYIKNTITNIHMATFAINTPTIIHATIQHTKQIIIQDINETGIIIT